MVLPAKVLFAIPKKFINSRCCLVSSKRPINVNNTHPQNILSIESCYEPLSVIDPNIQNHKDANKKSYNEKSDKRQHYFGNSHKRINMLSVKKQQLINFNERLNKAADLYDGWFSRKVENLDLSPAVSKT